MSFHISATGLDGMLNDFKRFASGEPTEHAKARLTEVAEIGYEGVYASIPTDDGDYRRPGSTLRESARYEVEDLGDRWEFTLKVGTEDDQAPYAKWVLYKNLDKGRADYLAPMDAAEARMEDAINEAFDDVWPE